MQKEILVKSRSNGLSQSANLAMTPSINKVLATDQLIKIIIFLYQTEIKMTTIRDSNRFGKLDLQTLNDFVKKYSLTLPDDYKKFLLEHNGGAPVPSTNKIPETFVQWIYGIQDEENWASLEWNIEIYDERMPSNTLPIASDPGGNQFLLSLRPDTYGEIWFWDHENESDTNAKDYFDNIRKSANSFSDFINDLYEYIDPDETEPERIVRTNDIAALMDLINSGYDINSTDKYERTLIENASIANKIEIVKILIDRKARKNNALDLAIQNMEASPTHGYEPLVKLLTDYNDKS